MKKYALLLFLLFAYLPISFSQKKAVLKYGKISRAELELTACSFDGNADAAYLIDKGSCEVVSNHIATYAAYEYHHRIKLFKKSAFDKFGKIELSYNAKVEESIFGLEAQVVQPNGTAYQLKASDMIDERNKNGVSYQKIIFPNLTEGCIIEFKYKINSNNLFRLKSWTFQGEFPVYHSEYTLIIPQSAEYAFVSTGFIKINKKEEISSQSIGNGRYVNAFETTYSVDSIAGLPSEPYITTMDDYYSQIKFQLARYTVGNNPPTKVMTNWQDASVKLLENDQLGKQLSQNSNFSQVWKAVAPLLEKATTPAEKVSIIYDFINKNIVWNEEFSFLVETTLNDAFKNKKANSGTLNLLLIALLKETGIAASPVLISTRDNGKVQTLYPIIEQFNHLICHYKLDEKDFLLDAGNSFRPQGYLRKNALNYQGFLLDKKQSTWINITSPPSTEAFLGTFELTPEGTMIGKIENSYVGYNAISMRSNLDGDNSFEKFKKNLSKVYPNIEIKDVQFQNLDKPNDILKSTITCNLPNAATVANDLIYIKPTIDSEFDENPFKLENRSYPVEFNNTSKWSYVLSLTIPKGYAVEELPKTAKIVFGDQGITYQYNASAKDNKIQLVIKYQINKLLYEATEYADLKKAFDLIAEKSQEQIVLKKTP